MAFWRDTRVAGQLIFKQQERRKKRKEKEKEKGGAGGSGIAGRSAMYPSLSKVSYKNNLISFLI